MQKERNDGKIVVIMDIDYVMGDLSDGNTSSRIHEYMEHNTVVNFKVSLLCPFEWLSVTI